MAVFQRWGYDEVEANRLALEWLPNIQPYDYTSAAGYPNGRQVVRQTLFCSSCTAGGSFGLAGAQPDEIERRRLSFDLRSGRSGWQHKCNREPI